MLNFAIKKISKLRLEKHKFVARNVLFNKLNSYYFKIINKRFWFKNLKLSLYILKLLVHYRIIDYFVTTLVCNSNLY